MKTLCAIALLLVVVAVPVHAAGLQEDLLAREKMLWKAWGDKDSKPFRSAVTSDYVQVVAGVGMVAGRDAVAAQIEGHNCVLKSFDFKDAKLRQPSPDIAILTYVATQDCACGGQALPSKVFATSMYVKTDGKWSGYSYQETPID
jgi:uncharacterized protein (TIGR02246 family)